ncbi:MAG: hypothetical protein F6K24_47855, partial [Okeania sp. SIO2D1]|nr:hypothetical protein [Okeania sp. SIO2D1]
MMDPLSILIWTAVWTQVAAGAYTIVYFIDLTFQIVFNWFRKIGDLIAANDRRIPIKYRNHLAATVRRELENNNVGFVTVDFNQTTGEVENAEVMEASSVDSTIEQAHDYGGKEVAIWS